MSETQEINPISKLEACKSTEVFSMTIGDDNSKVLTTRKAEKTQSGHADFVGVLRNMAENYSETAINLDNSYNSLVIDIQQKFRILETIQKHNEEMQNLKWGKVVGTHPPPEVLSLGQTVAARQQELLELLDQQVENLGCLKEDVEITSKKFPNVSDDSDIKPLKEKVTKLLENIENKMVELMQYRADVQEGLVNKSMEERIVFVNSLNEKLTRSVEQMTTEINKVRAEVNNFNFVRATASSIVLSIVESQDRV